MIATRRMHNVVNARLLFAGAALFGVLTHAHASAYSEAGPFNTAADRGGSGGRWFSGSAQDGYLCSTCHEGGEIPNLTIAGLPEGDLYVPGERYDVEVSWPRTQNRMGAVAEITTLEGEGVGVLTPRTVAELQDDERCPIRAGQTVPQVAVSVRDVMGSQTRKILHMSACGTLRQRYSWLAPNPGVGVIVFNSVFVLGNRSVEPKGDGVFHVRRFFQQTGQPEAISEAKGSCQVGSARGSATYYLLIFAGLFWRRRAQR